MKTLHTITWILLVVGGLNWGLEGLFHTGIGEWIPGLATLIYILVGLSAVFEIFNHKKSCKHCEGSGGMAQPM